MILRKYCRLLVIFFIFCNNVSGQPVIYEVKQANVNFSSNTTKELINAASKNLEGMIDIEKKTFAFRVSVTSFTGFNNPLQREHFNESYMESNVYPNIVYKGKIVEDIDFSKNDTHIVRAKGKMILHGVAQEKIIKATIEIKNDKLYVTSDFLVLLADYNIKIPRIVNDKLAAEINVTVHATLTLNPD